MTVKASQFRQNLFSYLDATRDQREALVIERGPDRFRLEALTRRVPIDQLPRRPGVIPDPDTLASYSTAEWTPDDLS